MSNCWACNNTGKMKDEQDFLLSVCTHCKGNNSGDIIDNKNRYETFINRIMKSIEQSDINIINAPCFIDANDVPKVCDNYKFEINKDIDTCEDEIIDDIINKIRELNLKYIYVVSWNYVNKYSIRGSE